MNEFTCSEHSVRIRTWKNASLENSLIDQNGQIITNIYTNNDSSRGMVRINSVWSQKTSLWSRISSDVKLLNNNFNTYFESISHNFIVEWVNSQLNHYFMFYFSIMHHHASTWWCIMAETSSRKHFSRIQILDYLTLTFILFYFYFITELDLNYIHSLIIWNLLFVVLFLFLSYMLSHL